MFSTKDNYYNKECIGAGLKFLKKIYKIKDGLKIKMSQWNLSEGNCELNLEAPMCWGGGPK